MRLSRSSRSALALALPSLLFLACAGAGGDGRSDPPATKTAPRPPTCPAEAKAPDLLPGVTPAHRTLDYWLARTEATWGDLDAPLLTPTDLRNHDRALTRPHEDGRPLGKIDLGGPIDPEPLWSEVHERLRTIVERIENGTYLDARGARLAPDLQAKVAPPAAWPPLTPELRVAVAPIPLRCGPVPDAFYSGSLDPAFDRNACSLIRPQEVVQILASWPNGMKLVRTKYVIGWIGQDARLSPVVPDAARDLWLASPRIELVSDRAIGARDGASHRFPKGTLFSPSGSDASRITFATDDGFSESEPLEKGAIRSTERPLTRRAFLEKAFSLLDAPYGWGGYEGGRDCSRYVLDVVDSFGISLPRHSARQSLGGTFVIDVASIEREAAKLRILDEAARHGIVLLHFPGHIMFYLGRTEDGRPMAIHSFSEYLAPCRNTKNEEGKPLETLHRVDKVTVSDLELGRGTSRRSFLERITRITVLGKAPGFELAGIATLRPAAAIDAPPSSCRDSEDVAIFRSPREPHPNAPMRIIAVSEHAIDPIALVLFDPEGRRLELPPHRLGGPPYSTWVEVTTPTPGTWTAVIGDGTRIEACERIRVAARPEKLRGRSETVGAWEARIAWERDTENLYAAFVEQLFREPIEGDLSWPRLQEVLRDPARNLLFDHLGYDEDRTLMLEPDCADLPYFLRAYFAFKLELPFAFRRCSRGRAGKPPICPAMVTHATPVDGSDPVEKFRSFLRLVANGVHSGSARTHPGDDATDLYPVELSRDALRPGTVFADPDGHLLVVAGWRPQPLVGPGVLVASDAQPDGTVSRRRFWRGTFLFRPETTDVGAGFKRFRPLVPDGAGGFVTPDNATLSKAKDLPRYSTVQYEGSADDFYDRVEALIHPRPLEAEETLRARIAALEESVRARILSIDNGEAFMAKRSFAVEMPSGYRIFETTGPWEDFATPSRDMRLLISIDAVTTLPDTVARTPERFGIDPNEASAAIEALRALLERELTSRSFEYTRSDGSSWRLSLKDVVSREKRLERAYNPNDCVEIRWGAEEGSDEAKTCRRRAPPGQQAKMKEYQTFFADRRRPPR